MQTATRRFILRLAIGLLTFLIGVAAVWALGGLNPFQNSSGTRYYRYQRSYLGDDVAPVPAFDHPRYRKHDRCRMRGELGELPPPPAPHADAPMPPSPPSSLR
jgi:hypothetical protein